MNPFTSNESSFTETISDSEKPSGLFFFVMTLLIIALIAGFLYSSCVTKLIDPSYIVKESYSGEKTIIGPTAGFIFHSPFDKITVHKEGTRLSQVDGIDIISKDYSLQTLSVLTQFEIVPTKETLFQSEEYMSEVIRMSVQRKAREVIKEKIDNVRDIPDIQRKIEAELQSDPTLKLYGIKLNYVNLTTISNLN